jgi:hypothetical protein
MSKKRLEMSRKRGDTQHPGDNSVLPGQSAAADQPEFGLSLPY